MAKQGKENIIAASFQLFLQHGYNGVSLNDIIQATQLSKGAIYYHFKSKHEIYVAAVEAYFINLLDQRRTDDQESHVRMRIKTRFSELVDHIDFVERLGVEGIAYPIRTFFIFQLECEKDEALLKKIKASMDHYRAEMISIIQTGIDKEEILVSQSAEVYANHMMSMMEGLVIHHSTIKYGCKAFLHEKYREVIDPYLDLIMNHKNKDIAHSLN